MPASDGGGEFGQRRSDAEAAEVRRVRVRSARADGRPRFVADCTCGGAAYGTFADERPPYDDPLRGRFETETWDVRRDRRILIYQTANRSTVDGQYAEYPV